MGHLHDLYRRFADRVEFFIVYIKEAHPTDGWQIDDNENEDVLFAQPKTAGERREVAEACAVGLKLEIPTLIDDATDTVEQAYRALPDRLYLVGRDGRIAYKSEIGPFGFWPKKFGEAIEAYLGVEAGA